MKSTLAPQTASNASLEAYLQATPTSKRRATRAQLATLVADQLIQEIGSLFKGRFGVTSSQLYPILVRGADSGLNIRNYARTGAFTVPYERLGLGSGMVVGMLSNVYMAPGPIYNDKHGDRYRIYDVLALVIGLEDAYGSPYLIRMTVSDDSMHKTAWHRLEREELIQMMTPQGDDQMTFSPHTSSRTFAGSSRCAPSTSRLQLTC